MKMFSKMMLAVCLVCGLTVTALQAQDKEKKKDDKAEFAKWIAGKWEVDADKSIEAAKKAGATDEELNQMEEMSEMTIEFTKDGGLMVDVTQFQIEGDWEVKSVETKDKKKHVVLDTNVVGPDGSEQSMELNVIVVKAGVIKIWPQTEDESGGMIMKSH